MDDSRRDQMPAELDEIGRRLRNERPILSGLELDRVKLQVERRAARPSNTFLSSQKGKLMKSRLALTTMLMLGVLMSCTGTGLAVSGVALEGNATEAQYPNPTPPTPKTIGNQVAGKEEEDNGAVAGKEEGGNGAVAGKEEGGNGAGADQDQEEGGPQATRQVSTVDNKSLPFTGFAAIPLIIVGLVLLITGAVLRRRLPQGA